MAEIVNLRMARKHKVRTDKERQAEQNRALHGRSRAQRDSDRKAAEQAEKFIDGHRLSRDTDEQ
ncbi:DUF4169 family protein [Mesorhizobium sp. A556]